MVRITNPKSADSSRCGSSTTFKKNVGLVAVGILLGVTLSNLMNHGAAVTSTSTTSMLLLSSDAVRGSGSNSVGRTLGGNDDNTDSDNTKHDLSPAQEYALSQQQQQQSPEHLSLSVSSSAATVPSFLEFASKHGTDKVRGTLNYAACMADPAKHCPRPQATNDGCKVTGHFYDRMYQTWLGPLAAREERFQFLEIGYYNGRGFDAYTDFLPLAEKHSLEISCLPPGPRSEGKWPAAWGNFAIKNDHYQALRDAHRLHCGDASQWDFLHTTWTTHMQRPNAPPLKVVIEDASHLAQHMVTSVFFWFPRIQPGGILVIEDIESQTTANAFRTEFLPQLMADLHYCGLKDETNQNFQCFPTIAPLLKAIHCELHICVLERNEKPAVEYDQRQSMPPPHALNYQACRDGKMS